MNYKKLIKKNKNLHKQNKKSLLATLKKIKFKKLEASLAMLDSSNDSKALVERYQKLDFASLNDENYEAFNAEIVTLVDSYYNLTVNPYFYQKRHSLKKYKRLRDIKVKYDGYVSLEEAVNKIDNFENKKPLFVKSYLTSFNRDAISYLNHYNMTFEEYKKFHKTKKLGSVFNFILTLISVIFLLMAIFLLTRPLDDTFSLFIILIALFFFFNSLYIMTSKKLFISLDRKLKRSEEKIEKIYKSYANDNPTSSSKKLEKKYLDKAMNKKLKSFNFLAYLDKYDFDLFLNKKRLITTKRYLWINIIRLILLILIIVLLVLLLNI